MFCPECRTEISDTSKFCIKCGKPVRNSSVGSPEQSPKVGYKTCKNCGDKISGDSEYCSVCKIIIGNKNKKETSNNNSDTTQSVNKDKITPNSKTHQQKPNSLLSDIEKHPGIFVMGVVIIILISAFVLISILSSGGSKSNTPTSSVETVVQTPPPPPPPPDPLDVLVETPPSDLEPTGELMKIFHIPSDYTDVQRENTINQIRGSVVQWTLPVYEVSRKEGGYKITTMGSRDDNPFSTSIYVNTKIYISPRSSSERQYIESLMTGNMIEIKGKIKGVNYLRELEIEPCILISGTSVYSETVNNSKQDVPVGNWVEYDRDQYDNICYYQKGKVDKTGNGHVVQVWDKRVYSDIGRDKMMMINNNVGNSNEGWEKLSHTITLSEIDCQNKRERLLSYNTLDSKGKILEFSNYNSTWENIFPNSIRDILIRKKVCE